MLCMKNILKIQPKQRMFYETMEEVLPDLELIIDSSDGVQKVLPLDSFFEMNEGEGKGDN